MHSLTLNSTDATGSPGVGPIPFDAQIEKTKSYTQQIKLPLDGLTVRL